jgi:prophage tail gpP-like protein
MPDFPIQGQSYVVQPYDDLQKIAVQAYGNRSMWRKIYDANRSVIGDNPGLIITGWTLFIPPEMDELVQEARLPPAEIADKKAVTIFLGGKELRHFQGRFAYGIDVLAPSWNADIAWTPGADPELDNLTSRDSFADSELYLFGNLAASGRIYTRTATIKPDSVTKNLIFFAKTKDIVDGSLSINFEYAKSTLQQIANEICSKIGFGAKFPDGPGEPYDSIEGVPTHETIGNFFQKLAAARGFFVSCDENSALVFQKLHTSGPPVAHIDMTRRIATEYSATFDNTKRYNNYIATSTAGDGKSLNCKSFIDPQVPAARQFIFSAPECDAGTLDLAASWAMLKINLEAAEIKLPVSAWTDSANNLWRPNSTITLKSPVLDIPEPRKYLIRGVEFAWTASSRSAQLSLVPVLSVDGSGRLIME